MDAIQNIQSEEIQAQRYGEEYLMLWAAVLDRAVRDLFVPEERRFALAWINRKRSAKDIGSFPFICDILGFNSEYIKILCQLTDATS